ncbi:MAG TPA: DNA replication and repair protein RecF, partial [Alphaproteobacteria bacterium]
AARREAVARIAGALAETRAPWPEARLALAGEVEGWLDEMPAVDAEQHLRARLGAGRRADAEAGRAGCGPHRSDLAVTHLESGLPAAQCSTGEQKALLISIVLANARLHAARRGTTPLVLLDEVAAHIDRVRRAALFEALAALGAQAWLSGTDAQLFEGLRGRAQFFVLADGRARAAAGAARW